MSLGETEEFEFAQLVTKDNDDNAQIRAFFAIIGGLSALGLLYIGLTHHGPLLTTVLACVLGGTLAVLSLLAAGFRYAPNATSVWVEPEGIRLNYERGRSKFIPWSRTGARLFLDDLPGGDLGAGKPRAYTILGLSKLSRTRVSHDAYEAIKKHAAAHGWTLTESLKGECFHTELESKK